MSFEWIESCLSGRNSEALSKVKKLALPAPRMEDWRYTDVRELFAGDWSIAELGGGEESAEIIRTVAGASTEGVRVVFANGVFAGMEGASPGVIVDVVSGVAGSELASAGQDVFGDGEEGLLALSKAIASQTVKITVAGEGTALIDILHLATDGHEARVSADSVVVDVVGDATACIRERFKAVCVSDYLRLSNTQVRVAKGAKVEWLREISEAVSAKHCGVFHARVDGGADFKVLFKTLSGGVVRNAPSVVMLGERASVGLHGVTVAAGEMRVDNTTLLDHRVGYCESRELFRGVYRDRASGAFTGKVRVHKDAQKTNAYQQNNALMLSERAEFNSRPVLQIWADDVKCTHGATVGAMDEDALRYMRSRGIGRSEAEDLLTTAFLAEVECNFTHRL